jgi:hypothetical protein
MSVANPKFATTSGFSSVPDFVEDTSIERGNIELDCIATATHRTDNSPSQFLD